MQLGESDRKLAAAEIEMDRTAVQLELVQARRLVLALCEARKTLVNPHALADLNLELTVLDQRIHELEALLTSNPEP